MLRRIQLAFLLLLAVAGLVVTIHLVKDHLAVYGGGLAEGLFCGGTGRFDCSQVAAHESSWLLGLPVAVWGLLYFIAVTGLALGTIALRGEDRAACATLGLALCTVAFAFDLYLGAVMVFRIGTICLNCVATYVINLLLAILFWRLSRGPAARPAWTRWMPSWAALRAVSDAEYYREAIKFGLLALTLAVGAFTLYTLIKPLHDIRAYGEREIQTFLGRLGGPPDLDMSRFAGQPALGPADARLTVALVGDFQCSYCRSLAAHAERLRERYPDRIRLIFVNSPISSECNPAIGSVVHQDACWLAEAGECAAAQGKFWPYHDYLYFRMPHPAVTRANVTKRLQEIGLDPAALAACMERGDAKAAVASDIALCRELHLTATPSVAINGYAKRGSLFPWMLRRIVLTMLKEPDRK